MKKKKTLEVGDIIFVYQYGAIFRKIAINRVTAKRAYTNEYEFERDCEHYIKLRGRTAYDPFIFRFPTKEIEKEWRTKTAENWFNNLPRAKFTLRQVEELRKFTESEAFKNLILKD